ncbi:hypothetical protein AVEN_70672-2-1, partial [Araneus ventricosus]
RFSEIEIRPPRTETCNKCGKLNSSVSISAYPAEKQIAETQLQLHILKSDEAQDIIKENTIRSQMPGSSVTVFAMDLQQIRVSRSDPNEISHKKDFSDLLLTKFSRKTKNFSKLPHLLKFPCLPTKNGISVEKKKDLLNLCDYLKDKKQRDFYRNLCGDIEMDTGNFDEDDG